MVDNGRGIPTEKHPDDEEGRSSAEVVMTELHAGGKFDNNSYKIAGGLHGVGVSVVNALSEWLRLTIRRDGKLHQMEFRLGEPVAPLKVAGKTETRGTEVHFLPAKEIFGKVEYHYEILAKRLRELSFLNNGVKIILIDQRTGKEENVRLHRRRQGLRRVHQPQQERAAPEHLLRHGEKDGIIVEVAMQWNDSYQEVGAVLHQQHPAARRRHAPDRAARGDDAHAQPVHRERASSPRRRRSRPPATT